MNTQRLKTLFIVLDSAESSLLLQWAESGCLPVLSGLLDDTLHGSVENVPGVYTVGTWVSLATAMQPPFHGRCSWLDFDRQSYTLKRHDSDDMAIPSFWQEMDRAGHRVAVIDFPRLPLQRLEHGIQVVDWYPHDLVYGKTRSTPNSFAARHLDRYPVDPCGGDCDQWRDSADLLLGAMLTRVEAKTDFAANLLAEKAWDHFTVSFSESHCIGHRCWHSLPETTERDVAALKKSPVFRVYQALDAAIDRLLDAAGDDATVVLLANPGMEASWHAYAEARDALRELDSRMPHGLRSRMEAERELDPGACRRAFERSFEFPVGNGFFAVRINLAGRERYGRLRPGNEADAYLRELTVDMMARKGKDGVPLFERTFQTSRDYRVGWDHDLPDLLFQWNRSGRNLAGTPAANHALPLSPGRSGDHRNGGMYLVRRPGLAAGPGPAVRDIDIGTTIARMSGVTIGNRDGKPIDGWQPET